MIDEELLEAVLWYMAVFDLLAADSELRQEFDCAIDLVEFMQYASARLIRSAARSEN